MAITWAFTSTSVDHIFKALRRFVSLTFLPMSEKAGGRKSFEMPGKTILTILLNFENVLSPKTFLR